MHKCYGRSGLYHVQNSRTYVLGCWRLGFTSNFPMELGTKAVMTAVQRVIGDFLTQTLLLGSTSHTDKSLTIAKMWAFSNGLQVHNLRASIKTFTPSYWYRRT